jgi:excisionase family DNA binding protein
LTIFDNICTILATNNKEEYKMENKNNNSNKQIMDIKELSQYLGIGKSKIYSLIRFKKIPASKIGKQYRFSKEIVDSWLKDKIITKKEEPISRNEKNAVPANAGENK